MYFICLHVCIHVCICAACVQCWMRAEEWVRSSGTGATMWVLGTQSWCSAGAAGALTAETSLQSHKHGAPKCDEVGSFIWTRTVTFNIQVSFTVTRTTIRFGTLPGFLEFKYCLSVSAGWFLFLSTFFLEDTASLGRLIDLWLPASVNHSSQCNHVIQESWS